VYGHPLRGWLEIVDESRYAKKCDEQELGSPERRFSQKREEGMLSSREI